MACEEFFFQKLRERGLRLTPQREMVLSVMHDLSDFATVDEIHQRVQALSASVDISTVYRTLELFQEFDLVACVDTGDGQRRFELVGVRQPHAHLVCRLCGQVVGVDLEQVQPLTALLQDDYGFEADLNHLSIPGVCQTCRASKKSVMH